MIHNQCLTIHKRQNNMSEYRKRFGGREETHLDFCSNPYLFFVKIVTNGNEEFHYTNLINKTSKSFYFDR